MPRKTAAPAACCWGRLAAAAVARRRRGYEACWRTGGREEDDIDIDIDIESRRQWACCWVSSSCDACGVWGWVKRWTLRITKVIKNLVLSDALIKNLTRCETLRHQPERSHLRPSIATPIAEIDSMPKTERPGTT